MSVLTSIGDALVNVVANLNTGRDKQASSEYVDREFSPQELLTMYRNSWLAAAIVDYPAEDATRNWRYWRAKADQISKIEAEEKRLSLQSKIHEALTVSRLYGGGALYINTPDGDQRSPLVPGALIRSLVVLTRHEIRAKEIVKDIDSPYYGKAEYYIIRSQGRGSSEVEIHASRLVILPGKPVPAALNETSSGWGDSYLQTTYDAILQTDNTMANIASLVFEAKIDVIKFQGFADMMAQSKDADVIRRLRLQAAMKGINGAVVIDAQDDYEQKSASFAGLTDVASKFQDNVSGAARIPVTRLFGRAAAGLSGSGEGDERVYYDRIGHTQKTVVGSAMSLLDDCIVYQALGSLPDEVFYEWAPLRQLTETERSDIFSKTATAARAIAGTNAGELVPLDALSDSLVNELVELGVLPGLEQSVTRYGTLAEQYGLEPDLNEEDALSSIGDASPRPLYVSRRVINSEDILEHYRAQGVEGLIDAGDMHVTVTYSRQPVDWMKMGEAWDSSLDIQAGGARITEAFGANRDTVVLAFVASGLSWRHEEMVRAGASWDWPEYQPHVTIAYNFDGDFDQIKPWTGEIKLGPEIFEDIIEDWGKKEE